MAIFVEKFAVPAERLGRQAMFVGRKILMILQDYFKLCKRLC